MISNFLRDKLKDRGWSLYRLHIETGGNISGVPYSVLRYIKDGSTTNPKQDTLKKIAKAFGDPVTVWMQACGYLDGELSNESTLSEFVRRPDIAKLLDMLESLSDEARVKALEFFETYLKGLK